MESESLLIPETVFLVFERSYSCDNYFTKNKNIKNSIFLTVLRFFDSKGRRKTKRLFKNFIFALLTYPSVKLRNTHTPKLNKLIFSIVK